MPPADCWLRLPDENDGLQQAASGYYGCGRLLPVAGTQQAIQLLPSLRAPSRVGVLHPSFSEHLHGWRCQGHQVEKVSADDIDHHLSKLDVLVLCNPNNPDGKTFSRSQLLEWHKRLADRGGWLVVDEAFMDATPQGSLAGISPMSGLIILRSLGKFFGLAGARVGFVLAEDRLLELMEEKQGPWSIAGPSRWVATEALSDQVWQSRMRRELPMAANRLAGLLTCAGLKPDGGSTLFQYVLTPEADRVADTLAKSGILIRQFPELSALRFGLPGVETQWKRLERGLLQHHS